jgi:tetratricopeptide (TPR) repeat protein
MVNCDRMPQWREELDLGRELDRAGDADGAAAAFARAQALAPAEADPAFALARVEERRGRARDAERLYRVALAARPDWPLAAVPLARLVAARAQPTAEAAIAEARRVLAAPAAAHPGHVLLAVVEAELLLDEDRVEEAKALLVATRAGGAPRVVDLALARAENRLGIALASSERADEAAFAFKRACDLDAEWAPPRANLGALWQRLGRPRQALEQYRRALALDPRHPLAQFNLGTLLRERGDLDGAARAFTAAMAADPPHAQARTELALALAERGDDAAAIELLEEELRLGQPTAATLRNLAKLYARGGRLVEAAALLQMAQGNSEPPAASK